MAWRIVKQPNGLLARFSDIVDNFTDINMTKAEALEYCTKEMGEVAAIEKVNAGIKDYKPWTHNSVGSGHDRWDDCLKTIIRVHGQKEVDELLKEINE